MPWPVYSERLLYRTGGAAGAVTYTVPEGRRAIVTWIGAVNGITVPAPVAVVVHGVYVWNYTFQAASASRSEQMYAVAYERETVRLETYASDINAIVCGFLFDDPVGNPAAGEEPEVEYFEIASQLPVT